MLAVLPRIHMDPARKHTCRCVFDAASDFPLIMSLCSRQQGTLPLSNSLLDMAMGVPPFFHVTFLLIVFYIAFI